MGKANLDFENKLWGDLRIKGVLFLTQGDSSHQRPRWFGVRLG